MAGHSNLVSLLAMSCTLTSVVVALDEPFCTSRFDFEEKLLHKVMRLEHVIELLQDKVTSNLTEFENRLADETVDKDASRWIGITDVSTEGVWEWRDGSNLDFVGWRWDEPGGKRAENCAALFLPFQYVWVDITCSAKLTPICEKELTSCPPA